MSYKPGLQLFIADWLSRHNNETNSDKVVSVMHIATNTIAMHGYTRLQDSRRQNNNYTRR